MEPLHAVNSPSPKDGPGQDWVRSSPESQGLDRYLILLRERLWLLILILIVTVGAAIAYLSQADDVYRAQADVLVAPVPSEATLPISLGLPSRSSDPLREIQTVAQLTTTEEVAQRAIRAVDDLPQAEAGTTGLKKRVRAEPVAESNLLAITAEAGDPDAAAAIANAFARGLIAEQTSRLHDRIDSTLEQLQEAEAAGAGDLGAQVAELQRLRAGPDPTLQIAAEAQPPTVPVAPRPVLTMVGSLIAGLVLGLGAVFTLQMLDPRLRREEQLRDMFRLPILTRVPRERRPGSRPLSPRKLKPATVEAFRTLRGTLEMAAGGAERESQVLLVTGSTPSEGKTTTAINLATSLATAGRSVILIEADLRRPAIGNALGLKAEAGIVSVIVESSSLEEALITADTPGKRLKLLLADYEGDWITELFRLPAAEQMIEEARRLADYVIVDSPPLTDVIDALPLTNHADQLLVVVKMGTTKLAKLEQLGELLEENGIRPVGLAVLGARRPSRGDYHYYKDSGRRLLRSSSGRTARGRL